MLSAPLERAIDFATTDIDIRLDIAAQVADRREKLKLSPAQLAESANIPAEDVALVEQGVVFEGSHEAACAILDAIARLEAIRAGKAHLRLV